MKGTLGILLVLGSAGLRAADEAPKFQVTTAKAADKVVVQADGAGVVFVVQSPSGIGSATIERTADKWPATAVVKLQLKGLESFSASNGTTRINAAVGSGNLKVRLWKDDKENQPLDASSPLWMKIQILDAGGKPAKALPLKNGTFTMTLPVALLAGNPKAIHLRWVDFYR